MNRLNHTEVVLWTPKFTYNTALIAWSSFLKQSVGHTSALWTVEIWFMVDSEKCTPDEDYKALKHHQDEAFTCQGIWQWLRADQLSLKSGSKLSSLRQFLQSKCLFQYPKKGQVMKISLNWVRPWLLALFLHGRYLHSTVTNSLNETLKSVWCLYQLDTDEARHPSSLVVFC